MSFPTDDPVLKSAFLAVQEATKNGLCQYGIGEPFLINLSLFLKKD
jgi:hypothetical protein